MTELNFLESKWKYIFETYDHFWLLFFLGYFVHKLPMIFGIINFIPFLQKYKIQKVRPSREEILTGLKGLIMMEILVNIPSHMLFYPSAVRNGFLITEFPNLQTTFLQFLYLWIIDDAWIYWSHYLMHVPVIYKNLHKVHHYYKAPFVLVAEYSHPLDHFVSNHGGIFAGALSYSFFIGNPYCFSILCYITIKSIMSYMQHSGYNFTWIPTWIPFYICPEFHDYHHEKFEGNYGRTRYWDWIMGTSKDFYVWKKKKEESSTKKLKLK